jgi:uncharacterized surface protein with fasciclin (FAS1) repeats
MKNNKNVYDVIADDDRFKILAKILESTGISNAMSREDESFTFFAPTDIAFCQLSKKALDLLTSPDGKGLIAAIVGQHLIPKSYFYADDLRSLNSVKTVHGNELKITESNNILCLEEAHVLMPGIAAANGVIFPIDKLLPISQKVARATA